MITEMTLDEYNNLPNWKDEEFNTLLLENDKYYTDGQKLSNDAKHGIVVKFTGNRKVEFDLIRIIPNKI